MTEVPDHINCPHIRRIQPIAAKDADGRPIVHLRDPFMLARDRILAVPAAAMGAIGMFDGEHEVSTIAEAVKRPESDIITLASNMDDAGLLWGPTCERMEGELKDHLSASGHFPMRHSRVLGATADEAREKLRTWMHETEDPEIEGEVRGLVVPRLDFNVMWPVYAGAYHTVRNQDIDHVLILSSNLSGLGDGVVLTQYGFATPLGTTPPDQPMIDALVASLGEQVLRDELDHMTEHGPEMQVPWLQECLAKPPAITAVLIPDPLEIPVDEDDRRITHEAFAAAARQAIDAIGGRTLVLAAVDLSHVGPQVGEPRPVDDQRCFDVERHDREWLGKFVEGDSSVLLEEARRSHNPTRWSGLGPLTMLLDIVQPSAVELIDYRQMKLDDKGMAMLTDASLSLT